MIETMTVPSLSVVFTVLSILFSVGVPVALAVLTVHKRRSAMTAVLMGAACFVIGALFLENLLHQLVLSVIAPDLRGRPVAYVLYGCLAAGIFEETARVFGLRILCRKDPSVLTGLAYGVGHGGIEAILVGATGTMSNLITMLMINQGQTASLLEGLSGDTLALAQNQLAQLTTLPPITFLATGLERLSALALHIALSILIWMVMTKKLSGWGYYAAILLHAGVNAFAALYQLGVLTNIWLVEGAIAVSTALVCAGVWRVYQQKAGQIAG